MTKARAIVTHLRTEDGSGSCDCANGIAFGRVTYGNVGSCERLDITVIGQAANVAAHLCDHGKILGHGIVATKDVISSNEGMVDLGQIALHNVSAPIHSLEFGASTQLLSKSLRAA